MKRKEPMETTPNRGTSHRS